MSEKLIICINFLFGHVLLLVETVYIDCTETVKTY